MRLFKPRVSVLGWLPLAAALLLAPATAGAALPPAPATPGAALPGLDLRQTLTAGTGHHAPGLRSAAPTAQALAGSVQQATGLQPSQLSAENVCPAPTPGQAACAAQVLVLRSDRRLVHPRVDRQATFTQLFPTRRHAAAALAAPPAGMSSSSAAPPGSGTPAYLQQAYDLTYLSQTAGGSDTVAVVDAGDDPAAAADLATYRSTYGLPPCTTAGGCFVKVNQNGAASPLPGSAGSGWVEEESLDLDAVSALCPNCHILLVEANSSYVTDLDAGIAAAVTLGADQVSNSFGSVSSSPVGVGSFPGATILAATGDHGYAGAGVSQYPAAYPGVTAVGGTTLSPAADSASLRGYSESAWSLDSSGPGWGGGSGCDLNSPKPSYQTDTTGCAGRSYSDVSADANPDTGLRVYDSAGGGWLLMGGTSLASPLVAAYEAVTAVSGTTAQWAYTDSALLNDPATGSSGTCAASITYICTAGTGYDGPTGIGSISGDIVAGAPGIGGPSAGGGANNTYSQSVGTTTASLAGGIYPNGLDTTYDWQYGTSTGYGQQTAATVIPATAAPVAAPATLSGLTPGTTYHYRLVAHNSAGTDYGYDYTVTTVTATNVPPVNSSVPATSGSARQGQTLTAATGGWSPTPTWYGYRWQRSTDGGSTWADIAGATGNTYTIAAGDLNDDLQVIVTATDASGSSSATSAVTGPVGSGAPVVAGPPLISGRVDQGQVLSAVSTWNPAGTAYTYAWQSSADGTAWTTITGATAATYTPTMADLGNELRVTVTATNSYGQASATSAAAGPVQANAPINTAAPTVTGTPQRTDTLSATAGSWTGAANTLTYQWQRSADGTTWASISGAAGTSYRLVVADEGDAVRVLVTASNSFGVTSTPSAATGIIAPYPPANTVAPTISGTAERGATLTGTQGTWTGPDNAYTYQWQEDSGEGYVNIPGASAAIYTPALADEGATVRVVVTATDPDQTISQASAPTATVTDAVPVSQTPPAVTGTAQRGSTLTTTAGTWAGIDNAYSYQWQRSVDGTTWTSVAGATGTTYSAVSADEGDQLRVLVTATNPDGTSAAPSAATAAVTTAPPAATALPVIVGTAQRGGQLNGAQGTWSGAGNASSYEWQRSADGATWTNVTGASSLSYTPAVADENDFLRLSVTMTNPDASVTAVSLPTSVVVATPPVDSAVPQIAGTPTRGRIFSATVGIWNGLGNAYTCQWQRSADGITWANISGATAWTYTAAVADDGDQVRALITAANADGTAATPSAASIVVAASPPVNTTTPTISGTPSRGDMLASAQGTWTGLGNAYAYQWQRSPDGTSWTNITGAAGSSYTLAVADEADFVRLAVTAVNPDATVTVDTAATAIVTSAPPVNTVQPSLSGSPQRGLTLVATQGTWTGGGNTYAYQWQRSANNGTLWTNISGATSLAYQLAVADEGDVVRLVINAINADGTVSAPSAASPTVAATPPVDTVAPTLTGPAQRGETLTSDAGTWLGIGNAYGYQWQRSTDGGTTWTDIAGATAVSYQLGVVDEGSELRLQLTVTNADGSSIADTAASALVPVAAPVNTVAPTLSGAAVRGSVVTATPGAWSGIGDIFTYQWQRSTDGGTTWSDVIGATGITYAPAAGDEGAILRVLVTAANPDGIASLPSSATGSVAASPPVNTALPTFLGIAKRGNSLSGTPGVWSGAGNTLTFQWQGSPDGTTWTNISGATGTTYTIGAADVGDTLRLVVTAANPDGTATAAALTSATVAGAPPVSNAPPSITGPAQRTVPLTAAPGSWGGVGNVLGFQWQRSADGGSTWTDVAGATARTYTPAVADENDNIRVVVTATNPDGTAAAPSAATAVVQSAPPVSVQLPTVAGTALVGATLSTAGGTWSPASPAYTYAWQRGDGVHAYQNISGATAATYAPVAADAGEHIQVVVTATNPDGSVSVTSAPTGAVVAPPVNLTAPAAPAGTLMNGYTLTPDTGSWDSTVTYSYTWQRCPAAATAVSSTCTPVSSAPTYTLTTSDVGSAIGVTVSATSVWGTTAVNSALTGVITGRPLTNTTAPNIGGNPQVPNMLSANPGTWSVSLSTATYQWERCAADGVSGCSVVITDNPHYSLTSADIGHTIVLIADVTSPGQTGTAQSPPLTVQAQPVPQATVRPTISGTPIRSDSLAATGGTWSNVPTALAYQWERCNSAGVSCTGIPGAIQVTYQLTAADEGSTVTVAVTATNPSGATTVVASPTTVVGGMPAVATRVPALSTAAVRQSAPVTVGNAGWQATSDTTYGTQWERCNSSGAACAPIGGATSGVYTPVAADVGHTLVAVITATNVDGSVPSASPASDVVLPAAPRWRDLPVLTAGSSNVGGTLTITPGVWTGPAVTTDATEVMRCTFTCVSVSSATGYTIATADIGAILRVRETAGDAGGSTVVWSAQYVGPVGSASSASAVLSSARTVLRTTAGAALAVANVSSSATVSRDALVAGIARRRPTVVRSVILHRAAKVRGDLRVWVCPVNTGHARAPLPCTRPVSLTRSARLKLPATMTGRIRIVVVRRGH